MGEEGSIKLNEEEEELLKSSSDENEDDVTSVKSANTDHFVEELDSFINEGDNLDVTVVKKVEPVKVAPTTDTNEHETNASLKTECNTSFINFQPTVQSTPNRPSTSTAMKMQPMPSIVEEDYSILYEGAEEEDDQFQTFHLDQLNENLDFTLLYSDNEEEEEESDEVTVVEVPAGDHARATTTNASFDTAEAKKIVPKKVAAKPKENSNDLLRGEIWEVRLRYYNRAVQIWRKSGVDNKQIPSLKDRRLRMPMIYKDNHGKIIGAEGPEEWADKVSIGIP